MRAAVIGEAYVSRSIKKYIEDYFRDRDRFEPVSVDVILLQDIYETCFNKNFYYYDIVFFSVGHETELCLKIAKNLKIINSNMLIVFISKYEIYFEENYNCGEYIHLIADNHLCFKICECLDIKNKKANDKSYLLKINEDKSIFLHELVYAESRLHDLHFHINSCEDEILRVRGKLDDLESAINDRRFIRVHKSFLVNSLYIDKIICYKAYLDVWDEVIPIPKDKYRAVKTIYENQANVKPPISAAQYPISAKQMD